MTKTGTQSRFSRNNVMGSRLFRHLFFRQRLWGKYARVIAHARGCRTYDVRRCTSVTRERASVRTATVARTVPTATVRYVFTLMWRCVVLRSRSLTKLCRCVL